MPLPANVKAIKIHPAIGVARVTASDDFYVLGDNPATYKTNGLMRRQAVQFRLFAYGDNNEGVEELTPQRLTDLQINVVWHARVGNRKVARLRGDDSFVLQAQASSDVNDGKLVGQVNGFEHQATDVPLGEIRPDGLFIPAKSHLARETDTTPISGIMFDMRISDNVGDGFIMATLTDQTTGQSVNVPVFPACVLIAPPDFAPDQDDPEIYPGRLHLYDWFLQQVGGQNVTPLNPVNAAARHLDREALERCTTDFNPGIEFSADDIPDVAAIFYPASQTGDANELRVIPKTNPFGPGVTHGEMTKGLCSPWQHDFTICACWFWAAQRPDTAFKDETSSTEVRWLRREVNDPAGSHGFINVEQLVEHVDKLGVVRVVNQRPVETERTDDIP